MLPTFIEKVTVLQISSPISGTRFLRDYT
ncbi:hypothetical protein LINGRAHAP2_LOCUS3346 [Linum grandiflorum]